MDDAKLFVPQGPQGQFVSTEGVDYTSHPVLPAHGQLDREDNSFRLKEITASLKITGSIMCTGVYV